MTDAAAAEVIKEPVIPADPAASVAADPNPEPKADPAPKADPVDPKPDFPDDWREKMAGGDEKELEILKRYTSPASLFKAHRELQQKMSSAKIKRELGENPTAEDLAAYRKDNGIPETPEAYDTKLSDGLVIGDDDKPVVDNYLKIAHENHMNPNQVKNVLDWYYKDIQAQREARQTLDDQLAEKVNTELRKEWGNEYKRNINLMEGYFGKEWDRITSARLPDGTPLASDKNLITLFAERARDYNPVATNVGGGNTSPLADIQMEMATIRTLMADKGSEYYQGPKAQIYQNRFLELKAAEEKLAKK